jgi:hypothetical protein
MKNLADKEKKILVISYNNDVDYCKVTKDSSQIEPLIRTNRTEFQIFSAKQNRMELSNAQKQEQMKGFVKLYKVTPIQLQVTVHSQALGK